MKQMTANSNLQRVEDIKEQSTAALARGTAFLLTQQGTAGNFEGQLSASTFPSCAYAWIQLARGNTPRPKPH